MSWKKRAREGAYHHGNLREALIQAARELIKEKGPAGFTFADAARSAGVSPAAPYRHFRDREALLADVAREGFVRFEAMLTTGWANGKPDALTAFNNVGRAYLAFARAEPAYYAAMFEIGPAARHQSRAARRGRPRLRRAAHRRRRIGRDVAGRQKTAGTDDELARLVSGTRHRVVVRPWRCRPPQPADVGRGAARIGDARLPAGFGLSVQGVKIREAPLTPQAGCPM